VATGGNDIVYCC